MAGPSKDKVARIKGESGRIMEVFDPTSGDVEFEVSPDSIELSADGDITLEDVEGTSFTRSLLGKYPYPYSPKKLLQSGSTADSVLCTWK